MRRDKTGNVHKENSKLCTEDSHAQFRETKHSISSTEGWKPIFPLKKIKWKYYSTLQKSTVGQTPTFCFYISSAFCKHLEAFLKNHPSTHIHLPLHLSAFPLQQILWCLSSLGLHAAPDCYAPGLTAHQKWPPHRACVCLCVCVYV